MVGMRLFYILVCLDGLIGIQWLFGTCDWMVTVSLF
jgi:hypothetical protein